MKSVIIITAAVLVTLLVTVHAQDSMECHSECDKRCFSEQGRMGMCDDYGSCVCGPCNYQGCKQLCRRNRPSQGRIAQCDEDECRCLK